MRGATYLSADRCARARIFTNQRDLDVQTGEEGRRRCKQCALAAEMDLRLATWVGPRRPCVAGLWGKPGRGDARIGRADLSIIARAAAN